MTDSASMEKRWYLNLKPGEVDGPYTASEINSMIDQKKFRQTVLGCLEGSQEWLPLFSWDEFDRRKHSRNQDIQQHRWYLVIDGKREGPFKKEAVEEMLTENKIKLSTQALVEATGQYVPLGSIKSFNNRNGLQNVHAPEATHMIHVAGNHLGEGNSSKNIHDGFLELANAVTKPSPETNEIDYEDFEKDYETTPTFRYLAYASFVVVGFLGWGYLNQTFLKDNFGNNRSPQSDVKKVKKPIKVDATAKKPTTSTNRKTASQNTPAPTPKPKPKIVAKPAPSNSQDSNSSNNDPRDSDYKRYDPAAPDEVLREARRNVRRPRRQLAKPATNPDETPDANAGYDEYGENPDDYREPAGFDEFEDEEFLDDPYEEPVDEYYEDY